MALLVAHEWLRLTSAFGSRIRPISLHMMLRRADVADAATGCVSEETCQRS